MNIEPARRPAFTLIELLVVIGIISLLVGLLIPAVQKVRESANRSKCTHNLRQIGMAIHNYNENIGKLPPNAISGAGHATWLTLLLPYLEQDNLYNSWKTGLSYYYQPAIARQTAVAMYFCPSRRSPGELSRDLDGDRHPGLGGPGALADYAAVFGTRLFRSDASDGIGDGAFVYPKYTVDSGINETSVITRWTSRRTTDSITDGLSNTIFIGEKHLRRGGNGLSAEGDSSAYNSDLPFPATRLAGPGYGLAQKPTDPMNGNFGSYHSGGRTNFLFGDGSVRSFSPSIDETLLGRLAMIADGQVVDLP